MALKRPEAGSLLLEQRAAPCFTPDTIDTSMPVTRHTSDARRNYVLTPTALRPLGPELVGSSGMSGSYFRLRQREQFVETFSESLVARARRAERQANLVVISAALALLALAAGLIG